MRNVYHQLAYSFNISTYLGLPPFPYWVRFQLSALTFLSELNYQIKEGGSPLWIFQCEALVPSVLQHICSPFRSHYHYICFCLLRPEEGGAPKWRGVTETRVSAVYQAPLPFSAFFSNFSVFPQMVLLLKWFTLYSSFVKVIHTYCPALYLFELCIIYEVRLNNIALSIYWFFFLEEPNFILTTVLSSGLMQLMCLWCGMIYDWLWMSGVCVFG